MNYPVWDVAFGAGLLIALVAVLHVFVSHFAVGGGLFLVLTEWRARRKKDNALLEWLKIHTKFFVLVTVVFGAVSGVGIWFTIGLISPTATSNLIHAYVWGWAIEWIFFFIEITAALLYFYGWDKLDARLHQWYGWIYFIAAFASMAIINGIITFMLTPGNWVANHEFWVGFFNPTNLPSLLVRFLISLALAGIYALITASLQEDSVLKASIVRWSAPWIIPSLLLIPLGAWWYIHEIPVEQWSSALGPMPTGTQFALYAVVLLVITLALAILTLVRPGRMNLPFSLSFALVALLTMGSFEFVREAVRKPYVIGNYLYANSLYVTSIPGDGGFNVDNLDAGGVLSTAKWINQRDLNPNNHSEVGRELFRVDCGSCHTVNAYRGVRKYLVQRKWDQDRIFAMLDSIDLMHNGVMPPFAGNDAERRALAVYLSSIAPPVTLSDQAVDGHTVYLRNCSMCHKARADDPLFSRLPRNRDAAENSLKSLRDLFIRMPDLHLSLQERQSLIQWVNSQRAAFPNSSIAQGGN